MVRSGGKYGSLRLVSECLGVEELASFVAGDHDDGARIDEHLAGCRACRRAVVLLASGIGAGIDSGAAASARPEAPLSPGAKFGRYTVLDAVGAGSTGVVYAAYDPSLDRKVALKVLRQSAPGGDGGRRLLFREARALARVSDEHVVHVFDAGSLEGRDFVAMEFVEGETLGAWIAREKPTPTAIVEVMLQAARGLSAAHAAGLVHRDFKPENVLLCQQGGRLRAKVADFGLAHGLFSERPDDRETVSHSEIALGAEPEGRVRLSTIGERGGFVGTPAYMAPEQAAGAEVDARADQFAFSVVLYEALAGSRPYPAKELPVLLAQLSDPTFVVSAAKLPLPAEGRRAIERGLRPRAADRFESLDQLTAHLQPAARRFGSWRARAAAVVALLIGSGAAWKLAQRPQVDSCAGFEARARERFSPERRQAMRAAFLATDLPYAEDAWQRVEQRVDAELAAWALARTEVCVDASSGGSQLSDMRVSCLQSSLLYTNALVDTLERADADLVSNAVAAAYALPGVGACNDFEALTSRGAPPPSSDKRAQYDELDAALARANAASFAGRYAEASVEAARIVVEAEALGDKPLFAKTLLVAGTTAEHLGKFDEARERYERSALVALAGRDDVGALAAGARLVPILAYRLGETPEARQWIAQTGALAERLGERAHPYDAVLLEGRGIAAYEKGAYAEAKGHYEEALKRLRRRGAGDAPESASILLRLAHAQRYLGDFTGAEKTLDTALSLRTKLFGGGHPLVADVQTELGALYGFNGRIDEARRVLEQALAIQLRALGPNHIEVAYTVNRLGNLDLAWGRLDDAIAKFRRVLALGEAALGKDNTEVGMAHHNIAECLWRMGKLEEALAEEQTAARIVEKSVGRAHPYFAMITNGLATMRRLAGQFFEATRLHEEALATVERALGADHADAADLKTELGRDALAAGDARLALLHFAAAEAGRKRERTHPLDLAALDLDWAEAASLAGDVTTAHSRIASARSTLASLPAADSFPRAVALRARATELEAQSARPRTADRGRSSP